MMSLLSWTLWLLSSLAGDPQVTQRRRMSDQGSTGWPIPPDICHIDRVSTEILCLICEELQPSHGEKEDLLALCLVSRRLYLVTTPYLYRNLRIDLTRASHIRLIQRLIHSGSQLASKIRWLTISGTEKQTDLQLQDIDLLFSRLVRLQEFAWNGSLDIPHHTLQTLRNRFPKAGLRIGALQTMLQGLPAPAPSHATLLHPGCKHLRAFHFLSLGSGSLYTGFKRDLIHMLHHNPQLCSLHLDTYLEPWDKSLRDDPELLNELHSGPLPRVSSLILATSLFTTGEIELCAQRGMFRRVLLLRVHNSKQFLSICARSLDIKDITFVPEHGLRFGGLIAQVDRLAGSKRPPFRKVRSLRYQTLEHMSSFTQHQPEMPWYLIAQMPRLNLLEHYPFLLLSSRTGPQLGATTTTGLKKLRDLVPGVQKIVVHISARPLQSRARLGIIRELATFERLNDVSLYLFAGNGYNCPAMLQQSMCRQIFQEFLAARKPTIHSQEPLTVIFKFVEPRLFTSSKWFTPDYRFTLTTSGTIEAFRRQDECEIVSLRMDRLTNDQLQSSGRMQKFARALNWDWRGYGRERERRESNADANATLWDIWAY
ncbi:hypothetical protein HBI56_033540 [Parastagonospora nodorum]|nr:hypothetical protein HBI10_013080 [Parastagonospora nodorum]KAH4011436.1 hypothetical protein HBI13_197510 [Parastagonospora nodorum]KAH4034642.1 hypothetical protein HBI09_101490 [Parastagonospora nodorum]KAH4343430.1 hypothetical protein HBH98_149770 [Parastagonospora nodorum]KAH4368182.1 hypothetical protein HBH97_155100 [Parastagonospora nodorum]